MTKQQSLRNTAEGLLAGLAAIGFEGPWRWPFHEWEGAFYRAWNRWPPSNATGTFRTFRVGGSANGRASQAREVLFAIKSNSPFHDYESGPLNPTPMGLTPEEYLEDWVEGASPEEWIDLATDFLEEMKAQS